MSGSKSLLSNRDRQAHPAQQIAKLKRIGRRAAVRAEWLATLLGLPEGNRRDPSFGYYAKVTPADPVYWLNDRQAAEKDRLAALQKAERAALEIQFLTERPAP